MPTRSSGARDRIPSPIDPSIGQLFAPRRARGRRSLVALLVAMAALSAAISADAGLGAETLPWRNAERAEALEAGTEARIAELTAQLADIDGAIAAARERTVVIGDTTVAVADDLRAVRARARSLAVESYMTGGGLPEALFLLDAPTANDFAFRSTLLNEGADAVADSTEDYLELRARASEEAVALAIELDALEGERSRTIEALEVAETRLAEAGNVVKVARIHARADELMARSGRAEPSPEQWAQVRECESLDDYAINTGNGFFGAYQFELETWIGVGGAGLPNHALPEEQDARARLLYAMRGAQPWPLCGRYLPGG
jgi:septal ring factor EnvC (AmiA/AmiB activator)